MGVQGKDDRRCPRGGLEFLAEIKADPGLAAIPVVVLTSSRAPQDIQRCFSLHASAYVTKPGDFDGMFMAIRQVAACFLDLFQLPAWGTTPGRAAVHLGHVRPAGN